MKVGQGRQKGSQPDLRALFSLGTVQNTSRGEKSPWPPAVVVTEAVFRMRLTAGPQEEGASGHTLCLLCVLAGQQGAQRSLHSLQGSWGWKGTTEPEDGE